MSVSLSMIGNAVQQLSATGAPLSGGALYTYRAGTSTPATTYNDSLGAVPKSNPIVLDSSGRISDEIWLTDGIVYKFVLFDQFGSLIATWDNIYGALGAGSALVSGTPQYVSAVAGTANAITLTPPIIATTYFAGQTYSFIPTAKNTGAVTVNVSGLGVKTLFNKTGNALTGEELQAAGLYTITYQANLAGFVLINSDDGNSITSNTFTPGLAFGGSSVGITYNVRNGQYIKIGNIVYFWLFIVLSNKGAAAGLVSVTGFPYTVNASLIGTLNIASGPVCFNQITFADKYATINMNAGSTIGFIATTPSGGGGPNFLDNTAFVNTSGVYASGFYPV